MIRNYILVILISVAAIAGACTSTSAPPNSGPNANTSSNVPPEFQGTPLAPDGKTTPGIPEANQANMSNMPKGATPTPGIPDPANLNKPAPKGATPTPGIPDEKTLKEQMNRVIKDANVVNRPVNSAVQKIEQGVKSVKKKVP